MDADTLSVPRLFQRTLLGVIEVHAELNAMILEAEALPGCAGHLERCVTGRIVDDEDLGEEPSDCVRNPVEDALDKPLGLERYDEDADLGSRQDGLRGIEGRWIDLESRGGR